jgi:hypothetical protein
LGVEDKNNLFDLSVKIRPIRVQELMGHGLTQIHTDKKKNMDKVKDKVKVELAPRNGFR